jgi:hypothetical protein
MAYKKVTRFITVEFFQAKRGKGYEVLITPEQAVVRCKDTVVWDLQGLPVGLARGISVGNFVLLDPAPPHVGHLNKVLVAGKPKGPAGPPRWKAGKGRVTVTLELGPADPGVYKYDLLGNGKTLLDPEMEIKGPKS